MSEERWKILNPAARKLVRGWVVVMKKDMEQCIVHSDQFNDSMMLYHSLPQFLTREHFELLDASEEVKVDWKNDRFITLDNPDYFDKVETKNGTAYVNKNYSGPISMDATIKKK